MISKFLSKRETKKQTSGINCIMPGVKETHVNWEKSWYAGGGGITIQTFKIKSVLLIMKVQFEVV